MPEFELTTKNIFLCYNFISDISDYICKNTPSELARELDLTRPTVTVLIDKFV